jgi:hypothetical protein
MNDEETERISIETLFGVSLSQCEALVARLERSRRLSRGDACRVLAIHGDATLRALVCGAFAHRTDLSPMELSTRVTRLVKNRSLALYLSRRTRVLGVNDVDRMFVAQLLGHVDANMRGDDVSDRVLGTLFEVLVECLRRLGSVDALHGAVVEFIEWVESRPTLFGFLPMQGVLTLPQVNVSLPTPNDMLLPPPPTLCAASEEAFQCDLRVALALSRIDMYYAPKYFGEPIFIDLTGDSE